jgi:hypothetical protein
MIGMLVLLVALLLLAGCAGGGTEAVATPEQSSDCMREQGYAIEDKPDLGFLTVGADQWYGATKDEQDLVVTYLDDADDAQEGKERLTEVTRDAARALDMELTDADADDLIHAQDRVLYWWVEASPGNEQEIADCLEA